jgi:predicted secreted protein
MVNISNGDPCGEIEFDYSASMVEAFEGRWVAWEDYAELKAEAERYRLASLRVDVSELHAQFNRALFDDTIAENARLKAEVERLTKAVMHSPAAQLKLKELEGKTTYKEINGKIPPCIDRYEAK